MSSLDTKPAQQKDTGGKARRNYASLEGSRGFHTLGLQILPGKGRTVVVRIQPMDEPSYWAHVGNGRWDAKDAMYEKMEEP